MSSSLRAPTTSATSGSSPNTTFRYTREAHILGCLDEIDLDGRKVLEIGLGLGADAERASGAAGGGPGSTSRLSRSIGSRRGWTLRNLPFDEIRQGSVLEDFPFADNSFDVVFSHGVLHHVPDILRAQREIARVLRPSGEAVVMLYARYSLNYLVSVSVVRRLGLTAMYCLDRAGVHLRGIYGRHVENARQVGLAQYLRMSTFVHRNTDGPDNPYSKVYGLAEVRRDFPSFQIIRAHKEFMAMTSTPACSATASSSSASQVERRRPPTSSPPSCCPPREQTTPDKPIHLYINSPGGSIYAGLAGYDTMQSIWPDAQTICYGIAMSMGRCCSPAEPRASEWPAQQPHLIHQPSGDFQGQSTDVEIHAEETWPCARGWTRSTLSTPPSRSSASTRTWSATATSSVRRRRRTAGSTKYSSSASSPAEAAGSHTGDLTTGVQLLMGAAGLPSGVTVQEPGDRRVSLSARVAAPEGQRRPQDGGGDGDDPQDAE